MLIKIRESWQASERLVTDESVYLNRRAFMTKTAGTAAAVGIAACAPGMSQAAAAEDARSYQARAAARWPGKFPAKLSTGYTDAGRPLTREALATGYNNFYEFTTDKENVKNMVGKFEPLPWKVEITGLCQKPTTLDLDDIIRRFPLEERVYRFRCVEAWAMTVPWTGIPLSKIIATVQPLASAKYIRFVSFLRPQQAPGQASQPWHKWPYYEGLRIDEAMHPLTLLVTGVYGKPLPKQNGAPVRVVVPWKYGYKSPKSVVKIELVESQPHTFWNDSQPAEYSFLSNVEPQVPHPRWSQATERLLGESGRVPSQKFNGYGQVASLYKT